MDSLDSGQRPRSRRGKGIHEARAGKESKRGAALDWWMGEGKENGPVKKMKGKDAMEACSHTRTHTHTCNWLTRSSLLSSDLCVSLWHLSQCGDMRISGSAHAGSLWNNKKAKKNVPPPHTHTHTYIQTDIHNLTRLHVKHRRSPVEPNS